MNPDLQNLATFATARRQMVRDVARITGRTLIIGGCGFLVFFRGESAWLFALAVALSALVR
ncbi:MAG: hypothetical protein C0502_05005 [Opitutus sp.]|nr:hypothetical protein [Opitutus sp.]